jgi:DNA-binding XRE family transcriptional regulator
MRVGCFLSRASYNTFDRVQNNIRDKTYNVNATSRIFWRLSEMAFPARLKELRERAGLTQEGLAERAGISKAGIANLEQGRNRPIWETVQKLATALGVDVGAFNEPAESDEKRERGRPKKAAPEPKSIKKKKGKGA